MKLNKGIHQIIRTLLPDRCSLCHVELIQQPDEKAICKQCIALLPSINQACVQCGAPLQSLTTCGACLARSPSFDRTFVPFLYSDPLSKLIQNLKFSARLRLARPFAELIYQRTLLGDANALPEALIPVPLHPQRLRNRGFNQSRLIASSLAQLLPADLNTDLVVKTKLTPPQSGLDQKSRKTNLRDAFQLTETPRYQHLGVVDDVITTGSTVEEIAKLLKKNGVNTVSVYAIAKSALPT